MADSKIATNRNFPPHLQNLLDNVAEVTHLLNIHKSYAGSGPGRKRDVEILNKSAIVLIVACWEAYVEDLATHGLESLIALSKNPSNFPTKVLEVVGSKSSGINAWKLAGDGWKNVLRDNLKGVLSKTTGALNTPKTHEVNELFFKTVGLEKISTKWAWPGRTASKAERDLDELVALRGDIAHRVRASKSIRKKTVENAVSLVSRLSARSNNEMLAHIKKLTGVEPWKKVRYQRTG